MNKFFNDLSLKALSKKASILLPETFDSRIKDATIRLRDMGFNIPEIDNFNHHNNLYIDYLLNRKFTANWPKDEVIKYLDNPVNKALTILASGHVDGVVVGASTSTSDVLRSSLRIVGIDKKSKWVSSVFLLSSPSEDKILTYADCAVIPEPSSDQLVSIAEQASSTHKLITQEDPKIAFLSFSTNGSANHYRVDRVKDAVNLFSKRNPDIISEGEIQFDAAINSSISNKKNKNSVLKGGANVFIFPNLDAGNISYKITRELAGYSACGPLLQGIDKPVHDLSRGCSVEDIINVSIITAIQKPS
tara:strand:- start:78 stop:989 length:912 start_codon:yes stop_codon:yes gene_type:complete